MQEGGVQHQMYQKLPDQPLQETHKFYQRGRGSVVLGAAFLPSNLGSSPSGNGAGKFVPFLFLGPPRAVYLSPPRCFTCSLGLAGCSVSRGISHSARKLARTPALSKKKKKSFYFLI